jgi:hypothetical protein
MIFVIVDMYIDYKNASVAKKEKPCHHNSSAVTMTSRVILQHNQTSSRVSTAPLARSRTPFQRFCFLLLNKPSLQTDRQRGFYARRL